MKQPLIGIPAYFDTSLPETMPSRFAMSRPYITALEATGALPVILPLALGETTLRALYERLDGLFMAGGGDLNPECYRQYRHPATGGIDDLRDQSEITLLRWALSDDMPILGVCRGSQALNVAAGGTLVQDIADQMPRALRHQWHPEKSRDFVAHDIELPYDSRLAGILGKTAHVNSFHHQAVDQLAEGLRAVAFAPDGVVEAVEHPEKDFCIGVQWHPEGLIFQDESMRNLFEVFVRHSRRKIA